MQLPTVIHALRWLLLATIVSRFAAAEELWGEIRGRVSIPPKFQQGLARGQGLSATRVILDGGRASALPTADGHFLINDVSAGAHLLQVVHPTLRFDPVRVETQVKSGALKPSAWLADLESGRGAKLKYPLGLAPSEVYSYLERREEFNLFSIFKSPMTLLSLFSFGAMFLLPKLQPMLEEEKERQRLEAEAREKDRSRNDK